MEPLAASTALTPVTLQAAPLAPCPTSSTARRMASAAPPAGAAAAASSSASLMGSSASMGAAPSAAASCASAAAAPRAPRRRRPAEGAASATSAPASPPSSSMSSSEPLSAPSRPRLARASSRRLRQRGSSGRGSRDVRSAACDLGKRQAPAARPAPHSLLPRPPPGSAPPGKPWRAHRPALRVSCAEGSDLRMRSTRACTSSTSERSTTALRRTCAGVGGGPERGLSRRGTRGTGQRGQQPPAPSSCPPGAGRPQSPHRHPGTPAALALACAQDRRMMVSSVRTVTGSALTSWLLRRSA